MGQPEIAQRQERLKRQSVQQPVAQQLPPQPPPAPPTPGQQIRMALENWQNRQHQMKLMSQQQMMQPKFNIVEIMQNQHQQAAMQAEQMKQQILGQEKQMAMQQLMPKQTINSSDNTSYLEQQRLQILEQLYRQNFGPVPVSPQFIQAENTTYNGPPLRPFTQPKYSIMNSAQQRPLGRLTSEVLAI